MGLMDKRAGDWTARDIVGAWSLTWILDLLKILLVLPFFFRKSSRMARDEILRAQRDNDLKNRTEALLRD